MNKYNMHLKIFALSSIFIWLLAWFVKYFDNKLFVETGKLKTNYNRTWYIIHAITNAIIVLLTIGDVFDVLADPYNALDPVESKIPVIIIMALHIYHCITDPNGMTFIDWIHHTVSCILIVVLIIYYLKGQILNYIAFFVCGLPGGIDYFLLALCKYNKIDRLTEKHINCKLNIYCRLPGIVSGCAIAYSAMNYNLERLDIPSIIASMTCISIMAINSMFFAERVVFNYGMKCKERQMNIKNMEHREHQDHVYDNDTDDDELIEYNENS